MRRSTLEDVFLTPHRPDAGRLMATVAVTSSSFERALRSPSGMRARTSAPGARPITTAFLNPIFFLLAHRHRLLGKLIDARPGTRSAALSYVEFVAPGLLAATAMQMGANDAMWPVMAGIKWLRTYHAMLATPVRARSTSCSGRCCWTAIRAFSAAVIFTAVWQRSAARSRHRGRCWRRSGRAALRARVQRADRGVRGEPRRRRRRVVPGAEPVRASSRCSCSRGRSSPSPSCPTGSSRVACVTPLWHGVELCRDADHRDTSTPLLAVVHVGLPLAVRGRRRRRRDQAPSEGAAEVTDYALTGRVAPWFTFGAGRSLRLVDRNLKAARRYWLVMVSGFFEPLFYLRRARGRRGRARRRHHLRRADDLVPRVRRAGAARGVRDERRDLRDDRERLLQAELRQDLRRGARDADGRPRRRRRRDDLRR